MNAPRLALITVMLAGCAAPSMETVSAGGDSAYVQGTRHGRDSYYVAKLDAVSLKRPPTERAWVNPHPVAAGERRVVVQYESIDPAFPGRPRRARAEVTASLVPEVHYAPDGRDNGRSVTVWIKRADTGERVSEEVVALKDELPALVAPEIPIRPLPPPRAAAAPIPLTPIITVAPSR